MGNPRQRRKARSSTHKPVSHSKNAKRNLKKTPPIRGPRALQLAWDRHKTVKQNYARLGLVHDLNPMASGGSEKRLEPRYPGEDLVIQDNCPLDSQPRSNGESSKPSLPRGFGRILRDEAGKVIGVELPDDDDMKVVPSEEKMEDLEPELDEIVRECWTTHHGGGSASEKINGLVEDLENLASKKHLNSTTLSVAQSSTGPNIRRPAAGEVTYLWRLVQKYGDDVERMAKDCKLNSDQKTEGQLRRALRNAGFLDP